MIRPLLVGLLLTGAVARAGAAGRLSRAVVIPGKGTVGVMANPATAVISLTVTPAAVSFTATDPDLGSTAGNTPVTVSWTTSGGSTANAWTLTLSASAASFANCPAVPVSAVTATCSQPSNPKGAGTIACNPPFQLSTAPQQVAGGFEDGGKKNRTMSVTVSFALTDSWSYVAALNPSCTLDLSYVLNVP